MTGADFGGFILGLVVVAIVVAIIVLLFHWLYLRSSKERAFVRTSMGGQKVVMNGGAFVLPIVHDVIPVNMNTLRLEVSRGRDKALITRDRMRVDVISEFYVRVQAMPAAIANAAQTLGQRTTQPEALKELLEGKFVDALRTVAAEMTMEELHEKRGEYIRRVRSAVAEDLLQNGLELESASLTQLDQTAMEFFNPSNAFDAEGLTRLTEQIERRKKIRNDIEQDTMIQIRNKNLETEKLSLDIDLDAESARLSQERQIEIARAGQRAELAQERAEKQQLAERAEIAAREQIERARLETDRVLETERIGKEREIESAEIERRRTLETAEQQRSIAIAQQSKAQSEAQAAADKARALAVADDRGAALRAQAEAEADADKIRALAARLRHEVDAEGVRAMNEAQNVLSVEARGSAARLRLIDKLDAIIREQVKPLENIEGIKILHVEGLGGGGGGGGGGDFAGAGGFSDQVVNSALRYRAQAPLIDELLKEIGIDTGKAGPALATGLLKGAAKTPKPEG